MLEIARFTLRSRIAICNICSGRLKVKVTLDGQMMENGYKLSLSGP